MKTNKNGNQIKVKVLADKKVISIDQSCTRILEISITPPELKEHKERPPLNLSLVLDRSGSMSGEKLEYVKKAAAHVIELLSSKDLSSLTVYDDQVKTLFPATLMNEDNKQTARLKLAEVHSGNSTNLAGGWLRGCELVAKASEDGAINRTLLLTDGLANVGMTNALELGRHARQIFMRGISTSCFGVGHGYDEHLLESMANEGGGNFHFIETLNAIPLVFEREFDQLVHTTLRETVLIVRLNQHIHAEVAAGFHAERSRDEMKVHLGSLYAGDSRSVYLKLDFAKGGWTDKVILPVSIQGKGEDEKVHTALVTLEINPVAASTEKATSEDQSLMERYAVVDMADKANEALKRERQGDRIGSYNLVQDSLAMHAPNLPSAAKEKYMFLSNELKEGMAESTRKRRHAQEYRNKRGWEDVMDFRMDLVNGHLIFYLEDKKFLLDSSSPLSVGKAPSLFFMDRIHRLESSSQGEDMAAFENRVGVELDGVMGMDILGQFHVKLDLPANLVQFRSQPEPNPLQKIQFEMLTGVPIILCNIKGEAVRALLDSGSKLSYIDQRLVSGKKPVSHEMGFCPGTGEFETDVYNIPVEVAGNAFNLRCGVLPGSLAKTLSVTGASGIIGSQLLQHCVLWLDFPGQNLSLEIRP